MLRTTRTHRRASLLATSSFVAASVLASVGAIGVAALPSLALAANECGTAPGILVCNPPDKSYPNGITYTGAAPSSGATTLQLNESQVTQAGPGANGVTLTATTGVNLSVLAVLQNKGDPAVNVAGTGAGSGILVSGSGGDVSVGTVDLFLGDGTPDDEANIITGGNGITTSTSGAGKSTITIGADTVTGFTNGTGTTGFGINSTTTGSGAIKVTTLAGGNVSGGDFSPIVADGVGINAASTGGSNVAVTVGGSVSGESGAFGVGTGVAASTTGAGTVNVTVSSGGAVSGSTDFDLGQGIVTNTVTGLTTISVAGSVGAFGSGAAAISAASTGTKGGEIDITTTTGGTLASDGDFGAAVNATTAGGKVNINIGDSLDTTGGFDQEGINSTIAAGGANGDLDVTLNHTITTSGTGLDLTNNGTGNINVTTNKGFDISTLTGDGIDGTATGGGSVRVNLLDGAIRANTSGNTSVPSPAMKLSAVGAGQVVVNAEDVQFNTGGIGDQTTTENGTNYVGISAQLTNTGGDGVLATSTGSGNVIVSGYNPADKSTVFTSAADGFTTGQAVTGGGTTGAQGVSANINTDEGGDIVAIANGTGNVLVRTIAGGTLTNTGTAAVGVFAATDSANATGGVNVHIGDSIGATGNLFNNTISISTKNVNFLVLGTGVVAVVADSASTASNIVTVGTDTEDATGIIIKAGSTGIAAVNSGTGLDSVTLGKSVTIDPADFGVVMVGGGQVDLTTGDSDVVTVTATGVSAFAPPDHIGLLANSSAAADSGGNPSVDIEVGTNNIITMDGDVAGAGTGADGATGILGENTGNGTGSVKINTGAGLDLTVTGDDTVGVLAQTSDSSAFFNPTGSFNGSGDATIVAASGTITLNAGDGTDSVGTYKASIGELAVSGSGNASVTNAANVTVTNTAVGGLENAGISSVVLNGGAATNAGITNTGTVIDNSGVGLDAENGGAGKATVLNNGAVTSTGLNGIQALTVGAGTADVNGSGSVTVKAGGGGSGIEVLSLQGDETVGDLGGGYTGAINNQNGGNGITAQILTATSTGNISVKTGAGGTIGVAAGDNTVNGILATTVGLGSVTVSAGDNIGSLATQRVNADGIDAEINNAANVNNLSVTTGGAVSIASVGDGVHASTIGLGNVSVTQNSGAGTINSSTGIGIHAVDSAGTGTGTVTVNTAGKVTTLANTAVLATSNTNGDVTVTQGATGVISATGGNGIDASNTSLKNGNVIVDVSGSTTASGIGIHATTNTNDDVTVTTESGAFVEGGFGGFTADGILATDTSGKDGQVTVNVLGNSQVAGFGNGVEVNSNGPGAIAVNTDAASFINATHDGILADENYAGPGHSANLVITANGVILVGGIGIDAEVTSATNNAAISVTAGTVEAVGTGNGITAKTIGGGNVTVTTNAGGEVFSVGGDGINASSSGGNGNVEVINNGAVEGDPGIVVTAVGTGTATEIANASVTGALDAIKITSVDGLNTTQINGAGTTIESTTNGDGIDATTSGKGSISISTSAGTAVSGGVGAVFDTNAGIFAKVGGTGTIGIEVAGSVTSQVAHTSFGIAAEGNGGLVTVTLDPTGQVLDGGILATNTTTAPGNGNVDVTLNGNSTVNTSSGDGIGVVTDAGAVDVQGAAGTAITADKGLELTANGISTTTTSGATTIDDQGSILVTTAGDAIQAKTNTGVISVTTGPGAITGATSGIVTTIASGAASTTITTGSGLVTGTTGFGISASTGGTGNLTLTTGPVTGNTGISTSTNDAGVTNITTTGLVTGTALDGIDATDNAGSGSITITTAAVSAVAGTDVKATSTGGANIIVTDNGALTGAAGVSASTNGAGLVNVHTKSTVTATGGLGVSAVAGTGGSTVTTDGLVKGVGGILASSTGGGATQVTVNGGVDGTTGAGGVGVNASSATGNVTVAANGGAADTIKGTTGVSTFTGGAGITTITTTGLVTGATADGIDATTTGSGLIIIDTGAVTAALGTGIKANSTTGAANIVIDTTGAVNGLAGISADNHLGAGSINVTDLAVTSTGGVGINATAGTGGAIVTANGPVTSTGGAAINATSAGGGITQVITGKAGVVLSNTGGVGINATSGTGAVIVTTNATVTGATSGITTTTGGAGTINIDTTGGGLVQGKAGDGIDATDSAGAILIQTGAVTGSGNGILATAAAAPITIDTNGNILGGNSSVGIGANTAGAGTIQINVLSGTVTANTGISTTQTGSGVTNIVDNVAANTITGTVQDGIRSTNGAGTGAVNVGGGPGSRIEAVVTGATNGIDISGAGPMNVFTDNNVTGGAGWGIKAVSTAAPVTVNVTTGTIQGTSIGGVGGGIFAKSGSTAANAVTVTSTTTVIGKGAGSNGIDAEDTTTGNVSVADTGPSVTGANDAIFASSVGGTVTVGTAAAPITSTIGDATTTNAGIQTSNTTGTTTIVTSTTAAINDPNALYGIDAASTTGAIAITNNGAIGTAGGGVNQAGIIAQSSGNNTTGITVTNNANIFVDNVSSIGLLAGAFGAPVSAGIAVGNEGTGEVDVNNNGNIDPPGVGILILTNGAVKVNNTANINAFLDGVFVDSFGAANVSVASTGATINGTTGDGIDAISSSAGHGTVTVGTTAQPITSNITAGVNGIDAQSGGVVGVVTSGTITGGTGTGIIAQSASGAFAGATVTVSTTGAISDAKGILASTTGTDAGDTVTVTVGANVTSTAGVGVEADGVNGLTSIALNTGDVNATGGDGLRGTSSGTGGVTITTAAGTDVFTPEATAFNDITAITTGAKGDINVTTAGTLNASLYAGNDAIFAQVNNAASTSNINVTTTGTSSIWGTHDAIEATTNGLGAITVNVGGPETFAFGNGIVATATNAADTKNVTVSVTGGGNVEGDGVGGEAILASTAGTGNVVVTVADGEEINEDSGAAGSGIIATNSGTAGTVTVTTGNGTIGETGELIGTDGINAQITNAANSGTVTVTNASTILMADGSDAGIKAISAGAGTVTVTNSGVIDPAAYGIYAKSGGNVVVNDSASITALTGIHAQSTGASSTVSVFQTNPLATITAKNGNGIEASTSGTGTVSVGTSASRIQGDVTAVPPSVLTTTDGIVATGNGSVQVWTGTGTITGGSTLTSWGIKAASGAGALAGAATTVNTEGHVTAAGGILASNTGTLGTDTVSVTTTGTGAGPVVNGALDDGVQAISNAGAITVSASVTNGAAIGTAVQGHTNGIDAASTGGGAITVTTSGNITGVVGFGIGAATTGGSGSVGVTTNDQAGLLPVGTLNTVSGQTFGITASSAGTGSTTVTNNTLVTATGTGTAAVPSALNGGLGPVGIEAVGGTGGGLLGKATGVTVNVNANVTAAGGRGIVTSSQNNALITIASGVTVKGLGDATAAFGGPKADTATHAVVDVSSVSGAVTTIANGGTIESVNGPSVTSYGDLAITAATTGPASKTNTGGVTINNSATGTILGRLELQGETASDNVIVNNAGVWHTTGNNAIGAAAANAETITNTGFIGTADNSAATLLAFGTGVNTVTNAGSGVIVLGESPLGGVISGTPATPAITTITGTVAFNNNGTIIMGNAGGSKSASDGLIDSTLEATGTTLGGTGVIDLDANLWSDTQSAAGCATSTLTAADCLVIGASTGTETIKVTDTKAHALGAFNPTGIVIVDGSSAAATFALNSGSTWFNPGGTNQFGGATNVLDKPGLFFYDLAYNGADKTERLIGVPKAAAFEFATVGGAANDLWYATTQTWFDRQADLRDGIDGKAVGSGPGVWLKMIGDWSQRDHNDVYTDFNKTYVFNVTYDQDTAAIIGGIDLLNVTHKNEAWVVGIDGGSVDSSVNFRASPDRFHLSGANVGGYATYMNGGLYVDGTINANLLNMQASLPQLQTTPNPWTASDHVQSFGGQVEAGYSMPLGDMLFWEPLGVVSYANTTLSPLAVPGGVQKLGDDDSFRASLGARVGATADFQYYKVKLTLTGRIWDEFSNDTLSTLIVPGGQNFLNNDNLKGVFGEISGQANLFTLGSGLSAFATGGVKFKSAYTEGTMTIGARYQF